MSWSFLGGDLILPGARRARQNNPGGNDLVVTLNTGPAGEADLGGLSSPPSGVRRLRCPEPIEYLPKSISRDQRLETTQGPATDVHPTPIAVRTDLRPQFLTGRGSACNRSAPVPGGEARSESDQ